MKVTKFAALLMATSALAACQGGSSVSNAVSVVTSGLSPALNSSLSVISGEITALEQVIQTATTSASLSAFVAPTDQDKQLASDVVARIDNLIAGWEAHKAEMNLDLLKVKLQDENWQKAEAVVKVLREDLRPAVNNVVNGKTIDTDQFKFMESKEQLNKTITAKKAVIFDSGTPTVISANTSSVQVSKTVAVSSADRVANTTVVNGEQTVTGGDNASNLTRTAAWTRTTTVDKEYDRTWTIETQDVTTTVFSDGTSKVTKGAVKTVPYKQTLPITPVVTAEDMTSNITYTTEVKNTPVVVVTRGTDVVVAENVDRIETSTQAGGSLLHTTIRKTTTTTTTPVTTTTTYPNITVYTYADGHVLTDDKTDTVVNETVDDVVVQVAEAEVAATTEHVVATETTTNEVVTTVAEADPVFNTAFNDVTTTADVGTTRTTTVTRHYTTTATVTTTTTTNTTPVTKQVWTDDKVVLLRGDTVTEVVTADTVVTDSWTKVMAETTATIVAVDAGSVNTADLGTPTPGLSTTPADHRTTEFNPGTGQDFLGTVNADKAYARGWTGKGSLITIADTGYDVDNPDLAGAVKHTLNTLSAGAAMDDYVGHGSHVLGIAAGRKNGSGMHGVAYNADVAVAKISDSTAFSFSRARVAAAWARDLGSVAFSVSANQNADSAFRNTVVDDGGGEFHSAHYFYSENAYNGYQTYAPDWAAALGSEQILVHSAGNQGYDYSFGSAQMATATDASGNLILGGRMLVVGNWNTGGWIDGNKAGHMCARYVAGTCTDAASTSDFYILAPGANITSAYKDGSLVNMSGTSMATPVVTGAIGVLHQMWPHMKGENLVKLVTATANTNLPGYTKATHGSGLLDMNSATQPVGATGIPTSGRTDGAIAGSLSGGAAVGNLSGEAFAALSNTMVLDSFERDFYLDLNNTQAVDTRPGSFVEAKAFDGNYDAYMNLANAGESIVTPEWNGITASLKLNSDARGDYATNVNINVIGDEQTTFDLGLGFVKETTKFLNNVQEGYMGVGEDHTTTYTSANMKHNFNDTFYGFGNYQLGVTNVEASKEFSLVTGYSGLTSTSWALGAGAKVSDGWALGATYSQPLSVVGGQMHYKVPTGRTLDGAVQYNEGSADVAADVIEHDTGLFLTYNSNATTFVAYGEHRRNIAGVKGNNDKVAGMKVNFKF